MKSFTTSIKKKKEKLFIDNYKDKDYRYVVITYRDKMGNLSSSSEFIKRYEN